MISVCEIMRLICAYVCCFKILLSKYVFCWMSSEDLRFQKRYSLLPPPPPLLRCTRSVFEGLPISSRALEAPDGPFEPDPSTSPFRLLLGSKFAYMWITFLHENRQSEYYVSSSVERTWGSSRGLWRPRPSRKPRPRAPPKTPRSEWLAHLRLHTHTHTKYWTFDRSDVWL